MALLTIPAKAGVQSPPPPGSRIRSGMDLVVTLLMLPIFSVFVGAPVQSGDNKLKKDEQGDGKH
jgi:hypothetical protein